MEAEKMAGKKKTKTKEETEEGTTTLVVLPGDEEGGGNQVVVSTETTTALQRRDAILEGKMSTPTEVTELIKLGFDAEGKSMSFRFSGGDVQPATEEVALFLHCFVKKRMLYGTSYRASETPQPPVCSSANGEIGQPWMIPGLPIPFAKDPKGEVPIHPEDSEPAPIVRPDGKPILCSKCTYNKWGSAKYSPAGNAQSERGKACSEKRYILAQLLLPQKDGTYIFTPGFLLVQIPPSRLGKLRAFRQKLELGGGSLNGAVATVAGDGTWVMIPDDVIKGAPGEPELTLLDDLIDWVPRTGDDVDEGEDGGFFLQTA